MVIYNIVLKVLTKYFTNASLFYRLAALYNLQISYVAIIWLAY